MVSSSLDDEHPSPKRRRVIAEEDDDDNNNDVNESDQGDRLSQRAARLEERAAERRRQRSQDLRQEVLELAGNNPDEFQDVDANNNNNDDDFDGDADMEEDKDYDYEANAPVQLEEEEDGEDLLDNAERDYQKIAALDTYGRDGLDDRDFDDMDVDQRRAAEKELNRRDLEGMGRNDGFYGLLDAMETEEDDEARQARRGMFARGEDGEEGVEATADGDETDEEDLDGEDQINLEAFDVPLREWIAQDRTRRELQRKFRSFLRHYTGEVGNEDDPARRRKRGNGIYEQKIRAMCAANHSTLQVSFEHLGEAEPVLAFWLTDVPKDMFDVLNEAATRHTLMLFPSYNSIQSEIHVRFAGFPFLDSLRNLRRSHLDNLVKVNGVITRRSSVYPQLSIAYYTCLGCKRTQGPFRVDGVGSNLVGMSQPDNCPNCENAHFKLHPSLSEYRNVQRANLQETPGSVPPGRVPRSKEVVFADDLIDSARPGEEVVVTGIYEQKFDAGLTFQSGFPVFSTFLTANHVSKKEDAAATANLSENDIQEILELAKDPNIGNRIVWSIAPSIYGHDFCKMALAMSLFGAVPKNVNDKHRIRGDSQLLKYAEYTAPRAVYSTGKGASAVGLTASVHKDPITREWTLEGGALVLADKGVCLIDEFDKMNEQDRTSIHEAMEQQSISVSKAGIVTSLQARCSVIAAANPIGGRYDSSNTLADNVELTDPILQRFDILCVLQDQVDPIADERLAMFVTESHKRAVPTAKIKPDKEGKSDSQAKSMEIPGLIKQDLLRKYIQYARVNVRPVLRGNAFDQEKVASLYVALRRESAASGGVPIAVRHIESIMRMAEAHAKMHLRDYVRDDDMDASIRMMLESFVMAQKFSVRRALKRSFAKFLSSGEDRAYLLLHMLQELFRKEQMYQVIRLRQRNQSEDMLDILDVPLDELESRARERRIFNVTEFLKSEAFTEAGYRYDPQRKAITRSVASAN
ncbi:licensing factor MCM2 [Seminavis robusta]|uniref:DNA replication licensing factor MCM2 n=1 Tax=Seminavis robusta TaxID=568900 RepID=A0A9N8E7I6_9STRA|nr:licensing factor MCM2 [Seminavis robusta]|eukprot:Sro752_g197140.1 licensing factor MCM2 (976) ;mRNA; r:9922-13148